MKPITNISCIAILLAFCLQLKAQQAESTESDPQTLQESEQPVIPRFSVNLERLEKESSANESFWLDINEHKTLVLKTLGKRQGS